MFLVSRLQRAAVLNFGRREPFTWPEPASGGISLSIADDAKLFLTTFVGGLLFMTIYLA